ncbi:hypothetical protein [Synechococcus phage Ssp-JY38]|nr:hypothetical protein [Synechococcus phage Yong-L2-223]
MASFVEQATLRIVDQSTRQIRTINSALQKLFATARRGKNIPIRFNLTQAQSQVRRLTADIERLKRAQTARGRQLISAPTSAQVTRINQAATAMERYARAARRASSVGFPMPPVARGFGPGGMAGAAMGARGGNLLPLSTTPFPFNIPTAFNIGVAHLTVTGTMQLAGAAVRAGLEAQATETRSEIIVRDPELQALLREVTRQAIIQSERISATRAGEISLDAIVAGLRGDVARQVVPRIAELEGQAMLIAPERSEELTLLSNKVLNLSNRVEDADQAMALAEGVFRASIVAGESFNAATTIAALRTSGFANTLDPEGLVGFSMAIDALGRQAGTALLRLQKELFTPLAQAGAGAGIAKGAVEALIASGIRDQTGLSQEQAERFRSDPALFIQTDIRDALQRIGIDVEDRTAVLRALGEAGFAQTSGRLIADALSSIEESQRGRELVRNIRFDESTEAAAADDLGAALKNLTAGFNTFSANVLDPLFAQAAPAVNAFGKFLETLGMAEGIGGQLQRLAFGVTAAATAFGVIRGGTSLVNRVFNPLNASASALNGSAAALTRAAVALGGSSVGGPAGRGRRGRAALPAPGQVGSSNFGRTGVGLSGLLGAVQISAATANMEVERLSDDPATRANQLRDAQTRLRDTEAAWNSWAEGLPLIGQLWQQVETGRENLSAFNQFMQRTWPTAGTDMAAITAEQAGPLRAELERLIAGIAARERAAEEGRLGPSGANQLEQQRARAELITSQLAAFDATREQFSAALLTGATNFNANADRYEQVFGAGADRLNSVGPTIDAAAVAFGPAAGQGLLAIAPEVGNAIGVAAAAQLNSARVNLSLPQQTQPADTGAFVPD